MNEVVLFVWDLSSHQTTGSFGSDFKEADRNSDGYLTAAEVNNLVGFSVTPSVMRDFDADGNSLLDPGEVTLLMWAIGTNRLQLSNETLSLSKAQNAPDGFIRDNEWQTSSIIAVALIAFVIILLVLILLKIRRNTIRFAKPTVEAVSATQQSLKNENFHGENPMFEKNRKEMNKKAMTTKNKTKSNSDTSERWKKRYSIEYEATFYENVETGETVWQLPSDSEALSDN